MKFFTPILAILLSYYPSSFWISGQIIEVEDGDTVLLQRSDQSKLRVRLVYIDAPETGQGEFAQLSTNYLSKFIGSEIKVEIVGRGYYGRYLGELYYQDKSLNFELVKKGLVWLYPWSRFQSLEQKQRYVDEQTKNKKLDKGIWGSGFISPWKYRSRQRRLQKRLKRLKE